MEDLGVDVGKSLICQTKALLKGCFARVLLKPGVRVLGKCMRGAEAGGWSIFSLVPVKCTLFKLGPAGLQKHSITALYFTLLSALEWNKIKGGALQRCVWTDPE